MPGDTTLGNIALAVGDQTIYSLIAEYAKGIPLSDSRAEAITQVLDAGEHSSPERTKEVWSALMATYSTVGANALDEVGIAHVDAFLEWARANHQGKLTESFYDMVNQTKSTAKLKALGREYVAQKAGGWSDDEIAAMSLPAGASFLPRKGNDTLIVRIPGLGDMPAKAAIRAGILKV